MTALRILIIGGNGIISASVSRLAVERGFDVTLLNRGTSTTRPPIDGARSIIGDADDAASIAAAVGALEFDVVVNFRSFLPAQVEADVALFSGRTGQYVYISSASAYQKPVAGLPIRESTPLRNPFWEYSRNKIASEDVLVPGLPRSAAFPRRSCGRRTPTTPRSCRSRAAGPQVERMRRGKPVVIHGDGTSLWTLTHARDFARAFVGLFGNPHALGETVHITSDEVLPWNQIATVLGAAAGVAEPAIVHVTSDAIARELPEWGPGLLGDKAHSVIFDNAKIKALVPGWVATTPFAEGAREIVEWHDADPARQHVDPELDAKLDRLVEKYG